MKCHNFNNQNFIGSTVLGIAVIRDCVEEHSIRYIRHVVMTLWYITDGL